MGIFQKIFNVFRPTPTVEEKAITVEEETAIKDKIAAFNLAIHQMTGQYITLGQIETFRGKWVQTYREIRSTRIPKKQPHIPRCTAVFPRLRPCG